jgi:hypothetical protein
MDWAKMLTKEKAIWNELQLLFPETPCHRYKWCDDCIIELRVPTKEECPHFTSNEKRMVQDIRFAKYRASAMYVVRIWDLKEKIWKDKQDHIWTGLLEKERVHVTYHIQYEVGKLVFPSDYDSNEYSICAPGIHYFVTLLGAWLYPQRWFTPGGETTYNIATRLLPVYGIRDAFINARYY